MSFYNNPIVDNNSLRSEESVIAVRSLFTRKNGFIFREETPDYGVDIDVELIELDSGASSKKFAIQIKSTGSITTAKYKGITYISFPFKTSRLGYLARRAPTYGLIVMYDEKNQTGYFDYVEDIISRLDDLEVRSGWRDQETVNVLIPYNELNSESLPLIHHKMIARHEASRLMFKEHGLKFNIPFLEKKALDLESAPDLKNPEHAAIFLETFGAFLFNETEFSMLLSLLGGITLERINASSKLIFLSAATYTQSGNVIEAEYFIKKARKLGDQLTVEEKMVIEFSDMRINFLKGEMNYTSYKNRLEKISNDSESVENRLTLRINIQYFELIELVEKNNVPLEFREQIAELGIHIETADIPEQKKHLLRLFHSETQNSFAVHRFINDYSDFKVKESLNIPIDRQERIRKATDVVSMLNPALEAVSKAYHYGVKCELHLLQAMAAQKAAKLFLSIMSTFLFVRKSDVTPMDKGNSTEMYARHHRLSLISYDQFLKLNMFQNAHESVQYALEIQKINFFQNATLIGTKSPEELLATIRKLETTYDLKPFESNIDGILHTIDQINNPSQKQLLGRTDEEITYLATSVLNAYQLPEDRLPNLIHAMKMMRTFQERCNNPEIEMLENLRHMERFETHYASLPKFILRHKMLEIETRESSEIEWLLAQFSTILSK